MAATLESDAQPTSKNNNDDTIEIYFDFGMSKPNQEGRKELLRLAEMAATKTTNNIELDGHTDDIGTREFNTELTKKRADFVARWIKSHGINAAISVTAKGECCRAAPYNKGEESLVEKRRVTIKTKWN